MEEQKEQVKEEQIEKEIEFSFFDNFEANLDSWMNQENI